jgi:hypothetical protein
MVFDARGGMRAIGKFDRFYNQHRVLGARRTPIALADLMWRSIARVPRSCVGVGI